MDKETFRMSWATENVTAGTHRVFRFADCRLSGLSGASSWVPSKTPATSARRSPRRGRQAASVCGAGRADRAPDDEPWREHHLPGRRTSLFQPLNGGRHGVLGLLLRVLADGGQVHVRQRPVGCRRIPRPRPTLARRRRLGERVKEPHGTAIVERHTAVGSSGWPSNAAAARRPDSSEWFPGMTWMQSASPCRRIAVR